MIRPTRPPRTLERILLWISDGPDRESLPGDFSEVYARITRQRGLAAARRWYVLGILRLLPSYLHQQITWGLEMIKNTLKITLRLLGRYKVFSFINIFGLAAGLAGAIMIFLWVQDELSYDRFHRNIDSLHIVMMESPEIGITAYGPGPLGPALKETFPEIRNTARLFGESWAPIRHEEKLFNSRLMGVDPSFFDMFSFPVIRGDGRNPLPGPQSMVLTKATASKLFGTREAVGQTVGFEWWGAWHDFQVTAVIGDIPANSHLQTDIFLPFTFVTLSGMDIEGWNVRAYRTYVQLDEGVAPAAASLKIGGLMARHMTENPASLSLFPVTRIHLHEPSGGALITYIYVFTFIGALILAVACINFMNLSTSRSARRAREVGLRKVVGSTRSQLVRQFLGESLVMTLLSFALALGLTALLLPHLNALLGKQLALRFSEGQMIGFLSLALLTGLISGSYPAFLLSSFLPGPILKESRQGPVRGAGLRKVLFVSQFAISIFLIASTLVVLRQTRFMRSKDLGINKECVINMELRGGLRRNFTAFRNTLLENPDILAVSATNGSFTKRFTTDGIAWEGKERETWPVMAIHSVDYDYADIFDISMAQGRFFSRDFPADRTESFIINESAARTMGMKDPVGKRISVPLPFEGTREGRIVGVVSDFHFRSLHQKIEPLILVVFPGWFTDLYVRMRPDRLPQTLAFIEKTIQTMAPDFPVEYAFLDDRIDSLYRVETRIGTLVRSGAILAVLIALLGLYGLAAFAAEQRTKEIGIRKVLGASVREVALLLSRQFALWVLLANVIAWPAAFFAARAWLRGFAYQAGNPVWIYAAAGGAALALALLTVGFHSVRAAAADPVRSIRYE
jgi:putative ABC transport system permease protein